MGQEALEIRDDSGGFVAEYALRLYEMEEANKKVEFVGRCNSACTLFLPCQLSRPASPKGRISGFTLLLRQRRQVWPQLRAI